MNKIDYRIISPEEFKLFDPELKDDDIVIELISEPFQNWLTLTRIPEVKLEGNSIQMECSVIGLPKGSDEPTTEQFNDAIDLIRQIIENIFENASSLLNKNSE